MMNIMILSNNKQNWFIKILFLDFFRNLSSFKTKNIREKETNKMTNKIRAKMSIFLEWSFKAIKTI